MATPWFPVMPPLLTPGLQLHSPHCSLLVCHPGLNAVAIHLLHLLILLMFPLSQSRFRGNGAASVTPASSSRPLLTQHTGRNWLNAEIVESCEGVRCRPARSSADVCQRGAVRQRMGGGNTPGGVSPHPQGARLALRLVRQGDGLHYPVGQPLFGDSLPFLLPSMADKELL